VPHEGEVGGVAHEAQRAEASPLQAIRDRGEGMSCACGGGRAKADEHGRVPGVDECLDALVNLRPAGPGQAEKPCSCHSLQSEGSSPKQYVDAFGLDTDAKRAIRLVFQPVLVAWALVSTDAVRVLREKRAQVS
jgi:hypothetical protein